MEAFILSNFAWKMGGQNFGFCCGLFKNQKQNKTKQNKTLKKIDL